ncbi:internalin [Listeria ivanovii]|uniref:leucine-rich repeat domain-containing protein n=1 Tax=Listeria ivanovii TaxID=1638 RepID=UPI000DA71C7B|nr:leucine-rich repeat domain-containing protein [Listeria ivanovii]PZG33467.1 internalin [Listeria ivanovii]PZG45801.1 internalin [Listeria ivanovii]PZH11118.1 internalin [Listeria ivanovii]
MKLKILLVRIALTLVVMMTVSIWMGTSPGIEVQAESITQPTPIKDIFPDPNFAERIREGFGKASVDDVVSQTELNQIYNLDSPSRDIQSIEGIQYLNNLDRLNFGENNISDISQLSGVTSLTHIGLVGNNISNLSPLANLTNLESLGLDENNISDISSLAGLSKLSYLSLNDNNLDNLSDVSGLINLKELRAGGNSISDLTPLSNLINMVSLYLADNNISDLSSLAKLTKINYLNLYTNNISNISVVANFTNIWGLYLGDNNITDITVLTNLTGLGELHLADNDIGDISNLANLTNLTELQLDNTNISDLNPLSNLTNLEYLYLGNNRISDIKSLQPLSNLLFLDLDNNQISDISILPDSPPHIWYFKLQVRNQQIVNSPINFQMELVIPNNVFDDSGKVVSPATISDNGRYTSPDITWNLPDFKSEVSYTFNKEGNNITFSGTVKQPLIGEYNVIFDVDGVEKQDKAIVGTLLTEPTPPTKQGYTFTGWYDAKTNGNKWDFATDKMPAKDITLYAQFSKESSPDNGGGGSTPDTDGNINGKEKNPTNDNTKTIKIKSNKNSELPTTGDSGNNQPIFIGFILLALGVFGLRKAQL